MLCLIHISISEIQRNVDPYVTIKKKRETKEKRYDLMSIRIGVFDYSMYFAYN